jgi:hypothetical protein
MDFGTHSSLGIGLLVKRRFLKACSGGLGQRTSTPFILKYKVLIDYYLLYYIAHDHKSDIIKS